MSGAGKIRWSECTALFGGTFDPPHLGHREAVAGLLTRPGVARVVIVPSASPPQKTGQTPVAHRLELVRRNFQGDPVEIDERELHRAERFPGSPSYTFDTLQEVRGVYPNVAFVIGTDQLANLGTWHRFPEILGLCHWIVLKRRSVQNGSSGEDTLRAWQGSGLIKPEQITSQASGIEREFRVQDRSLVIVPTEAREISSSEIRRQIATRGIAPEVYLRSEVVEYLKLHRIYGTTPA